MTAGTMSAYTVEDLISRAQQQLLREAPSTPEETQFGDHAIAGMNPSPETLAAARPAAVLIPVIGRPQGPTILLTQRSKALKQHSGQIAFPGGKIDPNDNGALDAALREAEEEIGLSRDDVTTLGFLGPYVSTTGFRITPVVALMKADAPLSINAAEVEDVFEIPLSFLMDPANHQTHQREWKGEMRRYFAMPYGDRYIWGVTAGIIRMLWLRLYAPRTA